jgi:uncharacterized protein (DUF433 family)
MRKFVLHSSIVTDPSICHGKPTFKGTRIMVWQVLEMLAQGATYDEVALAFPSISSTHIKAALTYAGSLAKEGYALTNLHEKIPA